MAIEPRIRPTGISLIRHCCTDSPWTDPTLAADLKTLLSLSCL